MGNLSVNNGGIATNKGGMPSIDLRYGPYESVAAAYAQLGPDGDDVITPGLTVGIISGSTVTEYWFQGGTALANLVPKQSGGETGNTPTGRFEVDVPLTRTNGYINSSNIFRTGGATHMLYPVEGFDKVVIYPRVHTDGTPGAAYYAFLTDNVLVNGETPHFSSEVDGRRWTDYITELEVDIPSDAVYVYLYMSSNSEGFEPQGLKMVRVTYGGSAGSSGRSMQLPIIDKRLVFLQGRFENQSNFVNDAKVVTSGVVQGGRGFALILDEGYVVRAVHLTDLAGNIVRFNYMPPAVHFSGGVGTESRYYGSMAILPQYGVIIEVEKSSGEDIKFDEPFIESFEYLDGDTYVRDTSNPSYEAVQYRLHQLTNLVYRPLTDIPFAYGEWNRSQVGHFQRGGVLMFGPPYSDVALYEKYIGQHVSFYTFLTALHNPFSLIYTESLGGKQSHYGIDYTKCPSVLYNNAYFGAVCSSLTGYVAGFPQITLAEDYPSINGMTQVTNPTFENVQVFDILQTSGHVAIITDIISVGGERKYVVVAEMTSPSTRIIPYKGEYFDHYRITSGVSVYRWNGWSGVTLPVPTPFINQGVDDYEDPIVYNDDICTFAGDKATFGVGDTIYLNVRRNNRYVSVKLYSDADALLNTIAIDSLAADTFVVIRGEDWVSLNLTTLNLAAGKYKACAVDGEGNESGFTYFEVLDVVLSVTGSGSTITVHFSSSNGTPYLVQTENAAGFPQTTYSSGLGNGSLDVSKDGAYVKVFVRGDYGVAVKRVSVN